MSYFALIDLVFPSESTPRTIKYRKILFLENIISSPSSLVS